MRGQVPDCRVVAPSSLPEALDLLGREPQDWRPLAGGTDLMVLFTAGRLPETRFLDLSGLSELKGIEVQEDAVLLGALCTFTELRQHPLLRAEFPNLVEGARQTGALAIQNRGTLGGNLVNGSPAADTPPSLLAYGAELELRSALTGRWVPCEAFHTGYKQNALLPGELLVRVKLPRQPGGLAFHYFRKVGTRKAQAISKTCLSLWARLEEDRLAELRIGVGSVAPVPFRARRTEERLLGASAAALPLAEAAGTLMDEVAPIDDIRSTAAYRRRVTGNLLVQALERLADWAGSESLR